jgi:hypothetical protein
VKEVKFAEGVVYEDILFTYELVKTIDSLAYANEDIYFYLKRENSITATCSEKNLSDFIKVAKYRYEDIRKRFPEATLYNLYALIESVIAISIKFVIAQQKFPEIRKKSEELFNIIKTELTNNEEKIIGTLDEFQKASVFMLTYDVDLFYNFLSTRHKKKTAK